MGEGETILYCQNRIVREIDKGLWEYSEMQCWIEEFKDQKEEHQKQ